MVMETTLNDFKDYVRLLRKDLDATPDTLWDWRPAPKARAIVDLVYEMALINFRMARRLAGEPPGELPSPWITAPAEYRDRNRVRSFFDESVDAVVNSAGTDALRPIQIGDATEPALTFVNLALTHTNYHGGQIAYIQTLAGDDANHWR